MEITGGSQRLSAIGYSARRMCCVQDCSQVACVLAFDTDYYLCVLEHLTFYYKTHFLICFSIHL